MSFFHNVWKCRLLALPLSYQKQTTMKLSPQAKQLICNSLMDNPKYGFIFQEIQKNTSNIDDFYKKCCEACVTLTEI